MPNATTTRRTIPLNQRLEAARALVAARPAWDLSGRVAGVMGLSLEVEGLHGMLAVGDRLVVASRLGGANPGVIAEVVGFRQGKAMALAFDALEGIGPGARVLLRQPARMAPGDAWLGRVIDPLGRPLDGKGPLPPGPIARPVRGPPPNAGQRARLGPRLDLGVRALNGFATCRQGQRLGLFAGSGVGKSTLLSMLARDTDCDVTVLALVGERGRELREFIEDDLGPAGLARSVVFCATSDAPPCCGATARTRRSRPPSISATRAGGCCC